MRVFTDGAEMGDALFWSINSGCTASTEQKRGGGYSFKLTDNAWSSNGYCRKNLSDISEFYYRFAWYGSMANNTISTYSAYLWFGHDATVVGRLYRNPTTGFMEYADEAGTIKAAGTISLPTTSWFLIEVHFNLGTSGAIQVKVDGVLDIDYSGNTDVNSKGHIDNIVHSVWGTGNAYIDDIAFNDTTGGVDDSWCGDGYIVLLKPNGNGTYSEFTGSDSNQTDNYLLVDDIPSDSDTTYVDGASSGDKDTYTTESIDLINKTVTRVWIEGRGMNTLADGTGIKTVMKSGGTLYKSSNIPLLGSYGIFRSDEYTTDPDTAIEWTEAGINALEIGMEVE